MSRPDTAADADYQFATIVPICDICGCVIVVVDQDCPALDEGVCFP